MCAILNAGQGVLRLEVDSAPVGLMGDADPATWGRWGIYGCAAGRRTCVVWSDGRVVESTLRAMGRAGGCQFHYQPSSF